MVAADARRRTSVRFGEKSASSPGCAKTPKWRFGRTKKGFSDPSPPKKTRHIETVEVVFPGSPAGEEFSHSLSRRRLLARRLLAMENQNNAKQCKKQHNHQRDETISRDALFIAQRPQSLKTPCRQIAHQLRVG